MTTTPDGRTWGTLRLLKTEVNVTARCPLTGHVTAVEVVNHIDELQEDGTERRLLQVVPMYLPAGDYPVSVARCPEAPWLPQPAPSEVH